MVEGHVGEILCGFKSRPGHKKTEGHIEMCPSYLIQEQQVNGKNINDH